MIYKYWVGAAGQSITTTPTLTVEDDGDGWYSITIPDNTTGNFIINIPGEQPVPVTYDLTQNNAVAGAVVSLLGANSIAVSSPITYTGSISIIAGDTYSADDGRAITWTQQVGSWPDLTGATIQIDSGTWFHPCSIINAGTDEQSIRLELTSSESTPMVPGSRSYQLRATLGNGHIITLATGLMTVSRQI